MPTYIVITKAHHRATLKTETVLDAHKMPFTSLVPGAMLTIPVGATLTDVNAAELAAFPDRFQKASDEPAGVAEWSGIPAGEPGQAPGAVVQRINPELMALLMRAQKGDSTDDEKTVALDIMEFLIKHNDGTATAEDVTLMEDVLRDFGMALFA